MEIVGENPNNYFLDKTPEIVLFYRAVLVSRYTGGRARLLRLKVRGNRSGQLD